MAQISATERERWVLYQLINPMPHQTKSERKKWDRIFDKLALEELADKVSVYSPTTPINPNTFDAVDAKTYELTSDQRDAVISLLEGPGLTTSGGRMLARFEAEIIKGRDGEQAAAS